MNHSKLATKLNRKKRNLKNERVKASQLRAEARSRIVSITLEKRTEALTELLAEVHADQAHSIDLMMGIDFFLFQRPVAGAHLARWVKMADVPVDVKRGLELYQKMQELSAIFEPRGGGVGPICRVKQLDRERMKRLDPEQRKIVVRRWKCFGDRKSPTLQLVAVEALCATSDQDGEGDRERGYSHRNVVRCIRAVNDYAFKDEDPQRDHMIREVNAFGMPSVTRVRVVPDWIVSLNEIAESVSHWPNMLAEVRRVFADIGRKSITPPVLAEIGRAAEMQGGLLFPDIQRLVARDLAARLAVQTLLAKQAAAQFAVDMFTTKQAAVQAQQKRFDEIAAKAKQLGPKKT